MTAQMTSFGRRPLLLRRFARLGPLTAAALIVLAVLAVVAALAPWLAPHDPLATDLANPYSGPTGSHLLGTDDSGRDILSRLLHGARPSLVGPAFVVVISMAAGTGLALLSAWRGGWVDSTIGRLIEIIFAFPGLILAIVAVAVFGTGLVAPILALSVAYIPILARVVRSVALKERKLPYVAALQIQGVSSWGICLRHILPNIAPLLLVQAGIGYAYAMLDLAAISYLGLGVQPPAPDWGVMIADGQASIFEGYPQQSLIAGLVVLITVVSLNLVSGRLADRLDVTGVN
jgi:peptide/nickel transport system permease protein